MIEADTTRVTIYTLGLYDFVASCQSQGFFPASRPETCETSFPWVTFCTRFRSLDYPRGLLVGTTRYPRNKKRAKAKTEAKTAIGELLLNDGPDDLGAYFGEGFLEAVERFFVAVGTDDGAARTGKFGAGAGFTRAIH